MPGLGYHEAVRNIESRGIMPNRPPSLEPMRLGLQRLIPDLHIDPKKVIVVAGTNGKGSVCASVEALLLAAGFKVGLYTSPHLEETTERIRIHGKDVSRETFCEAFEYVSKKTEDLALSHFEILTLMAAWLFFRAQEIPLDWAIFEVGLGGTWDATNAIPHHYCVITSLGLDHQNLLGHSLSEIAANKFGIIGQGATVVHSPLPGEVLRLAIETATSTRSHWVESIPYTLETRVIDQTPHFLLHTKWGTTRLTLPGERGAQNSATALTLFHEIGLDPRQFLNSLEKVNWPGRMEKVTHSQFPCPLYFSGDHNPQGILSLIELLKHFPRNHLHLIVGVGKDKDLHGILTPLFALQNTSFYLTETPFRGLSLTDYKHWLQKANDSSSIPDEILEKVRKIANPGDLILVTGSLYLVGYLKHRLRQLSSLP